MEIVTKTASAWECIHGQILDSRFEAGDLLQPDRDGVWFRARDLTEGGDVLVFLEDEEQEGVFGTLERFREAAFLEHPNLLRVLAAGRLVCGERSFAYIVTETAEFDLAEDLKLGPMGVDRAADLFRQVAAGLTYLHGENLVSCAVRAGGIWRVNDQWKLADYTQLRVPGKYAIEETRKLLLLPAFEAPPDANEGIVSPAWDVWSLGSVLRKVFPPSGRGQRVPPPFDAIVSTALDPDRAARPSFDAMLHELAADRSAALREQPRPAGIEPMAAAAPAISHARDSAGRVESQVNRRPQVITAVVVAVAVAAILAFAVPFRTVPKSAANPAANPAAPAVVTAPPSGASEPDQRTDQQDPQASSSEPRQPPSNQFVEKEISSVLNLWVDAKRNRDLDEEMACYAPSVDTFFGQHRVSASNLRRQERNTFTRIGTVHQFDISNLAVRHVNRDATVVSFDKTWDFRGHTRFAGSSREELIMRPVNGEWKISSERELKVYWVKRLPM